MRNIHDLCRGVDSPHVYSWFGVVRGFCVGAIISPPDAVAATAATKAFNSETGNNDTGRRESGKRCDWTIAYKYAVAAVVSDRLSSWMPGYNLYSSQQEEYSWFDYRLFV
jgi:hypothetical protein